MCKTMAEYPLLLLLIPLAAIIVPLVHFVRSGRRRGSHHLCRPPPGPWALPVIGHLHHLLGAAPAHHKLRDLSRRHGPLMLLRFGELRVVVASSAAAAREITKTHDLAFATRPVTRTARLGFGDGAFALSNAPYGDAWRQLRKMCTVELLSTRRVRSFRAVREQEVARLLQAVASESASASAPAVNLSSRISSYVADSTALAIIGGRFEDRATFLRLLDEALRLVSKPGLPDLFPSSRLALLASRAPARMKRLQAELMAFMDTVIRDHQLRKPAAAADDDEEEEDLVDVLLRIHSAGGISMDTIKMVIADLFIAGSETTATALQWAMSELVRNPGAMWAAQDEVRRVVGASSWKERVTESSLGELRYLSLVVKETLRLHPPGPLLLPRECRSPCRVLGFDVPVGATLLVNAWAIGRDPAHWDAPEEFVPERFRGSSVDFRGADAEFLPFGAGRRMCPGSAFGLANVELALASLLYHFDWKLPRGTTTTAEEEEEEEDGGCLDMAEVLEVTARRRAALSLVPVVHMPVPPV